MSCMHSVFIELYCKVQLSLHLIQFMSLSEQLCEGLHIVVLLYYISTRMYNYHKSACS